MFDDLQTDVTNNNPYRIGTCYFPLGYHIIVDGNKLFNFSF